MTIQRTALLAILLSSLPPAARAGDGLVPRFAFEPSPIALHRLAQPGTYFDKVGRKFALLGFESGSFEAWAYPLKLVRNFEISFLIGSSTQPIPAKDIVRFIDVTPEATTLTYVYQSFSVKATYVAAVEAPGAVVLLAVDSTEPLTVVCSFLPVLQPMWPAGLGGQYASWDDALKAYLLGEPTRRNHGYVGSPAARGISYTPAHMLSDTPTQFKIAVEDPAAVRGSFIPIVLAGGEGKREDVRKVYESLAADPAAVYREAADHFRRLARTTLRVKTPNPELDLAFEWAKVAYDNLIVDNPDLGRGLVAGLGTSGTGGRPGFGWFFGGDAFMNSLSLNAYGAFSDVRDALAFTRKWQREDGKVFHELSQAAGYLNWFKDYPYGYIHGDTTPFYIAACYDYMRMSGDVEFIKAAWPSITKAYAWCLTTDADGDGLMDNGKAGLGALEFGALTGIKTDIYLAAAWVRAAYGMERLARAVGDGAAEKAAHEAWARAEKALESKFWDAEKGRYTYAFNADGGQVKELTPWCAVPLAWGQGDLERGGRTLEAINGADLTTDWGVRMLSNASRYYEPLNYNYGAVWPFLTGWVATALFKNDYAAQGYHLLVAAVRHTFDNALGEITELFSGSQNVWPQEGVSHQGFSSSGVAFPLVRGLLGLEGDALKREIRFEPRFPADWSEVSVDNCRVGAEAFSLRYRRTGNAVRLDAGRTTSAPWTIVFSPAFGPGTRVTGAKVNGRSVALRPAAASPARAVRPVIEAALSSQDVLEFTLESVPEILPPAEETRTGDASRGLRILTQDYTDRRLTVIVEGLAGETYRLPVAGRGMIREAAGAEIQGTELILRIPGSRDGGYVRHKVVLTFK